MLSNNAGTLALAVAFTLGALLFVLGSAMVRREREAFVPSAAAEDATLLVLPPWTADLAGTNDVLARELRVDMIERLAMIGEPWSVHVLERARRQDPDASVRDAADNALIVVAARRR